MTIAQPPPLSESASSLSNGEVFNHSFIQRCSQGFQCARQPEHKISVAPGLMQQAGCLGKGRQASARVMTVINVQIQTMVSAKRNRIDVLTEAMTYSGQPGSDLFEHFPGRAVDSGSLFFRRLVGLSPPFTLKSRGLD